MTGWRETAAPAKLNLALVVGPLRADGKHEVVTVLQRISLADTVAVRRAESTAVTGFEADTLVRSALERSRRRGRRAPVRSADREADPRGGRARRRLERRRDRAAARERAARDELPDRAPSGGDTLGADVPFFLRPGPQLATGDGTTLEPVELPTATRSCSRSRRGAKASTGAVYDAFDARAGAAASTSAPPSCGLSRPGQAPEDLALLPPNDLASSPLAAELRELGAFRADVTGAGPVVYGLFATAADAQEAAAALEGRAAIWTARPA